MPWGYPVFKGLVVGPHGYAVEVGEKLFILHRSQKRPVLLYKVRRMHLLRPLPHPHMVTLQPHRRLPDAPLFYQFCPLLPRMLGDAKLRVRHTYRVRLLGLYTFWLLRPHFFE